MGNFIVSASPIAAVLGGAKVLTKPAVSAPQQQSGGTTSTRNYYFFPSASLGAGAATHRDASMQRHMLGSQPWHGDVVAQRSIGQRHTGDE